MNIKTSKGFSLLEILLSIVLISILIIILIGGLNPNGILSEVRDNKREADALTIYQALEQYALKNNSYPTAITNMSNNSSVYICKTTATSCNNPTQINLSSVLVPTYLAKIPEYSTDSNNSGFYIVKDTNGKIGVGGVKGLDNSTFVKGLNTQNFSTNVTTIQDPYWNNVSLLMNFSGDNGSVNFNDISNSNFNITRFGNAQISTLQTKFNSSSGALNTISSGGDYLTIDPNTNITNWWSTDYTLEFWTFATQLTSGPNGEGVTVGHMQATGGISNWSFGSRSDGSVGLRYWTGSPRTVYSSPKLTTGNWYHLAFTVNGGTIRVFINGNVEATGTVTGTPATDASPFTLGGYLNTWYRGYIYGLRITKGTARYTSNFTPPDAPFPTN